MHNRNKNIPPILRLRKLIEQASIHLRLPVFMRGSPLLVFLFLYSLLLGSLIGSILQIIVIWSFPPSDWSKAFIDGEATQGIWRALFTMTYFAPNDIGVISFLYVIVIGLTTWLFGTKVKQVKHASLRYIIFYAAILVLFSKWIVWSSVPIKTQFSPWIADLMLPYVGKYSELDEYLLKNIKYFTWMALSIPILAILYFLSWYTSLLLQYYELWGKWFNEYEFEHSFLTMIKNIQRKEVYPDAAIGIYVNKPGNIKAIIPGKDRATHLLAIGSIGTGKSAASLLPLIRCDMKHLVDFINSFQIESPKQLAKRLSGLTIIDPSDDLCSKSYQLAKAHGIPDEAIFYLNPDNPETKSYNPMRGPIETVAATFVYVLEGIQPDQEDFYKNTQAVHLYNHILLLKLLHANLHEIERIIRTERPTYPDLQIAGNRKSYLTYEQIFGSNHCTLDTLMKLYDDPWLVKQAASTLKLLLPKGWEKSRGDQLSHYSIINSVGVFMEKCIQYKRNQKGEYSLYPPDHKHSGLLEVEDRYSEKITGLTNVLMQMNGNTRFRRVMFGDSGLDLDILLKTGGVLLINTDDGEMGKLSRYFAQVMLQSLVQAFYRRDIKNGQPHGHHVIVDEFPKYCYETYPDFPANGRKYGAIITIAMQTISQLEDRFSSAFIETIVGVHRNRLIYQGVPLMDAEYFSKYWGTKKMYVASEGATEQASTQDSPGRTNSTKYQLTEVPRFTPQEISESNPFEGILQINSYNKQLPAERIKADFVPEDEFVDAKKKPLSECARAWVEKIQVEATHNMNGDTTQNMDQPSNHVSTASEEKNTPAAKVTETVSPNSHTNKPGGFDVTLPTKRANTEKKDTIQEETQIEPSGTPEGQDVQPLSEQADAQVDVLVDHPPQRKPEDHHSLKQNPNLNKVMSLRAERAHFIMNKEKATSGQSNAHSRIKPVNNVLLHERTRNEMKRIETERTQLLQERKALREATQISLAAPPAPPVSAPPHREQFTYQEPERLNSTIESEDSLKRDDQVSKTEEVPNVKDMTGMPKAEPPPNINELISLAKAKARAKKEESNGRQE